MRDSNIKVKKIENSLSINLHNQLISEFIGEFKNFETSIQHKRYFSKSKNNKIFWQTGKLEKPTRFLKP